MIVKIFRQYSTCIAMHTKVRDLGSVNVQEIGYPDARSLISPVYGNASIKLRAEGLALEFGERHLIMMLMKYNGMPPQHAGSSTGLA